MYHSLPKNTHGSCCSQMLSCREYYISSSCLELSLVFLGNSVGSVWWFFLAQPTGPGLSWASPPGRRKNALDPWGVVCGDVIGYKMDIVRCYVLFWRFSWREFLSTIFWWRWNTPTREGNKHFSRWWRFSNSFIFTPHLGGWSNLTVRILFFKWVEMKPPSGNSC